MHPQEKAVSSLLYKFQKNDFVVDSVFDGEQSTITRYAKKLDARKDAVDIICSVDQSWVRVKKDDKLATLFIVLGNDDSEILCDYSSSSEEFMKEIELVAEEFYQQWEKD
jgi:Icc-related predicted phosphoesterase